MNRLSKDIYVIDEALNAALLFFLLCLIDALGTIVAISCITPLFLTVLPIFAALYFYIQVSSQHILFFALLWQLYGAFKLRMAANDVFATATVITKPRSYDVGLNENFTSE